jgi:hypothetical protein
MVVHSIGGILIMRWKDQSTQKYLSHCHFVDFRFHIEYPEIKPRHPVVRCW